MTAESDDRLALARRLLADAGIHPGALMVSRIDAVAAIADAFEHGRRIAVAEIAGERHCRVCGCTALNACRPPCGWAGEDLCTACADAAGGQARQ
jgi:hypothetical protein